MQTLDFTDKNFEELQFNNETLIIMAHQRKIITFNNHEELWKIKYILEEISDKLDEDEFNNKNENLINGYCKSDVIRMLVDDLEEESYFLETNGHNEKIGSRKLKVINAIGESYNFNSDISIYFGYLNSSDNFLNPEWYETIAKELKDFALNSGRCKEETIKLLMDFSSELLLEYEAYKNNKPYFKVIVEE